MTTNRTITPTREVLLARERWRYRGEARPTFAAVPASGQESVWDFPRPPRIEPVSARLRVLAHGRVIADTCNGVRVLETAGAPTFYFPPADTDQTAIEYGDITSLCEWKGAAQELTAAGIAHAGWRYVHMYPEFDSLYEWPSFYPGRVDCFVGDEQVRPQPGGFYGGWVTDDLAGPIKGEANSSAW